MAWTWRAAVLVLVGLLAASGSADAKKKPPLKGACQLVTTAQVDAIMGRKMVRTANAPTGCGWQAGPKAQASIELYGFATVKATKQYFDGKVRGYELCVDQPD